MSERAEYWARLVAADRLLWPLDRPRPALPNSCFWTWDHGRNSRPDDPGVLNSGCTNWYPEHPDTYLGHYGRSSSPRETTGAIDSSPQAAKLLNRRDGRSVPQIPDSSIGRASGC